jgi:threonylcarbamoyladenosine tRNA methylthiotransferase MtaB
MKISFYNIGCKLNYAEVSHIQKLFEDSGYEVVNFKDKSDIILINTCTVTHHADADSRKYIRRAIRNNPDAFIVVMGCYSQLKPDEVTAIDGVDVVLGTNNKYDITELIHDRSGQAKSFEKKKKPEVFIPELKDAPFHFASSVDNESRTRIVFKIQDGCDYVCTYCTIPKARGKSRSMDFYKLKEKFSELDKTNYHEVVLSGVNVGEYKARSGENFTDVLRYLAESNFSYRVRISSIEPNLLTDEIIELTKTSENLCNHFHIPLQSGSPDILKAMKRRYDVIRFEERIHKIKEKIPGCCIGIDVIEGFPGETEEHFKQTFDLLERLPVSYLHVFTYSQRIGTPAANYDKQVEPAEKKKRTKILRELSDIKKEEFIKSQLGEQLVVIPERVIKVNNKYNMTGLSDNYIKVKYESINEDYKPQLINMLSQKNLMVSGEIVNRSL